MEVAMAVAGQTATLTTMQRRRHSMATLTAIVMVDGLVLGITRIQLCTAMQPVKVSTLPMVINSLMIL